MNKLIYLIILTAFLAIPAVNLANAQVIDSTYITNTAGSAGFVGVPGKNDDKNDPNYYSGVISENVGAMVSVIISFVGTIFFIFVIASGIQWMTAGGNEEQVNKSRKRLINASIGLLITVAAYFITWFISNAIL